MSNLNKVRTRIAPSPTGKLHIGGLSVALKNYAYAKGRGGQFIIRIEDTDRERLVPEALENILSTLKAYGLDWDEGPDISGPHGPYTQSERLSIYQQYAKELVEKEHAYYCFCTKERLDEMRAKQQAEKQLPKYDRTCLNLSFEEIEEKLKAGIPHVVRLKVPRGETVTFTDLNRGDITFQTDGIDDQVLLKSDGYPTYHLGVVVDDHLMEITHVIRGEEWISSTPKHVLLYKAFDWELPIYAHMPDLLSPTGKGKMSKRHGDVSAEHFLEIGYLPEAMLNFLMILGWASSDQTEVLTLERYIKEFDIKDVSKKSVAFDTNKLDWLNGLYIRQLGEAELIKRLQPYKAPELSDEIFAKFLPLIKERLVKLSDIKELSVYLYQDPVLDQNELLKQAKMDTAQLQNYFKKVSQALLQLPEWSVPKIEEALRQLQLDLDLKPRSAFMSIRYALTGSEATPPLFDVIELLGKEKSIQRLQNAI